MNRYVDTKGRLIFVRRVKSKIGDIFYSTWYVNPLGRHNQEVNRLNSIFLPARYTEADAQADLDRYAAHQGWEVI